MAVLENKIISNEVFEEEETYSEELLNYTEKFYCSKFKQEFINYILFQKDREQDAELEKIKSELSIMKEFNFKPESLYESSLRLNQKGETEFDKTTSVSLFEEIKQALVLNKEVEDIQEQIENCVEIANKILIKLESVPKEKDNYRRHLIMLLYTAIKRNYAIEIFSNKQIDILIEITEKCNEKSVSESEYFNYDEQLYECDLEVMAMED